MSLTQKDYTDRKSRVLDTIKQFIDKRGYSPSYRDIASITGYNLSHVHFLVGLLSLDGAIKQEDNMPRTIRLAQ